MRIGLLRGREDSFPNAFMAKVNSMGTGVTAEPVQLGGTRLNEPVPYRVIVDRMSHEVPYFASYLRMASLQGVYCINSPFWRPADDEFLSHAAAQRLGVAVPKSVLLPNKSCGEHLGDDSLRNLWPVDFGMFLVHVGAPCILKPVAGGGGHDVSEIHSLDELLLRYDASGRKTMMLQELVEWDTHIRVPTVGRRHARAIRYDQAPAPRGTYDQDYDALSPSMRDEAEELALKLSQALGHDMNVVELAIADGRLHCVGVTSCAPDLDYQTLRDAHFPWVVEKMAELAVEKALAGREA
jgi:glutathione synthase/RimK-type ligase-like ATP-grasp enzyme